MCLYGRKIVNVWICKTVRHSWHLTKDRFALFSQRMLQDHGFSTELTNQFRLIQFCLYETLRLSCVYGHWKCARLLCMVMENTSQIRSWNYFVVESITGSNGYCFLFSIRALSPPLWISRLIFQHVIHYFKHEWWIVHNLLCLLCAFASLQHTC